MVVRFVAAVASKYAGDWRCGMWLGVGSLLGRFPDRDPHEKDADGTRPRRTQTWI